MSARRFLVMILALATLGLGAGCGGGDSVGLPAETDEPLYQQGKQLQRQGRDSEALATFLKVIEKRGEQSSPESNLEAGVIYSQHIKDPIEATHYLRKYLELEPNSKRAPLVRQRIETAKRELFRAMPGSPNDEQAARFNGQDLIDRLQRENDELRAELGRQRGNAPTPFLRTTRGPVEAVEVPAAQAPVVIQGAPVKLVPTAQPYVPSPTPAPASTTAQLSGPRTPVTKAASPTRPGAAAGRRHTVALKDTLYSISRKFGVTPEAIAAVNRDVLPGGVSSKLSPGMELKIP